MVKTKKLSANCSVCKRIVEIEVPDDLAKGREFYPFEYIHIHGEPEHALMLFLDQNLAVRDAIAYKDLTVAQKKGKQYQELLKMSEIDAFASIFDDPLRLELFTLLTQGPQLEVELIEKLKKMSGFQNEEFNLLMLPLIRTELVKSNWLKESFQLCYFLIKDFSVFRTPSKYVSGIIAKDPKFKSYSEYYFKQLNEALLQYKREFMSSKEAQQGNIRRCLEMRSKFEYLNVLNELNNGPMTAEEISKIADKGVLQELIEKKFIMELKTKSETYYVLLNSIKIKKFPPKYLVEILAKKVNNKEITPEMALTHLNLLFDAEK